MRGRGCISRKSWRYFPIATQNLIKVQLQPTIATWVDVLKLVTGYLGQSVAFRFSALEMDHGLDPFQEVGASRGDSQNNQTSTFDPSWVCPYLMVLGTLDLEDFKVPYLSTSNV
jgi:hypothetical protein